MTKAIQGHLALTLQKQHSTSLLVSSLVSTSRSFCLQVHGLAAAPDPAGIPDEMAPIAIL
jgi:hypothetical protein